MIWPTRRFGEIMTFLPKSKLQASNGLEHGRYKFFTSSSIQKKWIDTATFNTSALVFGSGGSASVHFVQGMFSTTADCFVVEAKNKNDIYLKYVYHFISSNMHILEEGFKGAGLKHISKGYINELMIPLPPLDEQMRIADILDKAAAIKAKREQAIAKLDELASNIFEEAVSRSQIIKPLGELCDVRDGTHDSPKYVAEGFPLITSKNVVDGKIDQSTASFISEEDYKEICKRSKVDCGDILMPMIGTIGNPVIIEEPDPRFAIKNVALIKFKSSSPKNTYINAFLKSKLFYQYVRKISRGGTQKFLGLGDIRKMPIPMLTNESEVEFCEQIKRVTMLREITVDKLAKVNSMVASLQHQAFTTGFPA